MSAISSAITCDTNFYCQFVDVVPMCPNIEEIRRRFKVNSRGTCNNCRIYIYIYENPLVYTGQRVSKIKIRIVTSKVMSDAESESGRKIVLARKAFEIT